MFFFYFRGQIHGEESNTFTNNLNETVTLHLNSSQDNTRLLKNIFVSLIYNSNISLFLLFLKKNYFFYK